MSRPAESEVREDLQRHYQPQPVLDGLAVQSAGSPLPRNPASPGDSPLLQLSANPDYTLNFAERHTASVAAACPVSEPGTLPR